MFSPKIYWEVPEKLTDAYSDALSSYFDSIALGPEIVWRFGIRNTETGQYVPTRSGTGSYHDNYHGAYRKVQAIRRGFVQTFPPGNDDIRLLFEELEKWQGSSVYGRCYQLIRVWDGVLCDPKDRATRVTLRIGTIIIKASEGSLWNGKVKCLPANDRSVIYQDIPTEPITAWNPGFKVIFEPIQKQIIN